MRIQTVCENVGDVMKYSYVCLLLGVYALPAHCESPYPPSNRIENVRLDWATHQRSAQGSDNFQLTWCEDGHLYGAWGDGGGFGGTNSLGRQMLGVARIEGPDARIESTDVPIESTGDDYRGFNVWGGHSAEHPATFNGKSWGMICVQGVMYMWVVPDKPRGKSYRNHYEYIELAVSTDRGATWTKRPWRFHESENLTIPTFLNFGRNNEGVPPAFGDYVYSYFIRPNNSSMEQHGPSGVGLVVHRPGAIYLARVKTGELAASKAKYEFFQGADRSGDPLWGSLAAKKPVFQDPSGVGWCMSASYNPYLKRVLLCTENSESKTGSIGIFDSPTPWGPWTTVKYHSPSDPLGALRPGSDLAWRPNVFFAAFATKWFNTDRFVLNFTGAGSGKDNDSFNTVQGRFILKE
jgi:hypothetical protein